jgi:hypothetical protein
MPHILAKAGYSERNPDPLDRRAASRFRISFNLSYRVMGEDTFGKTLRNIVGSTGQGRTVNISSSGILFTTKHALVRGTRVEVEIEWPVKLDHAIPLKLVVQGRIVRSEGAYSAGLQISSHDFRLAKPA